MAEPHTTESTLVSDHFTFTTSSAYLVYLNLHAVLPYNTLSSTTGSFYTGLTLGYPQESIYTYHNCNTTGYWPAATINYEDYNRPPKWSVVSSQRPCHPWNDPADSLSDQTFPPSEIATQYTDYVNRPVVVLPQRLTPLDPTWSTCMMGDTGLGLLDPAIALQGRTAMVGSAATTTLAAGDAEPDLGETAQPASGISGSVPAQTSVVVTLSNGDTIVAYPPVGASILPQYTQSAQSSSQGSNPDQDAGTGGGIDLDSGSNSGSGFDVDPGSGSDTNPEPNPDEFGDSSASSGLSDSNQDNIGSGGSSSTGSLLSVQVGGYNVQAAPDGGVVVNGVTLDAASPTATIGGVQVSLQESGIVVGGNTIAAPQPVAGSPASPISLNGHNVQVIQGSSGPQLVVDGQAIPAGSSQADVGGSIISVMTNGQISVLPTTLPYVPVTTSAQSSGTISAGQNLVPQLLPNGEVEIAGATLSAGAPATMILGTPISVLPNNEGIVIGGETISPIPTSPPNSLGLSITGQIFTPLGGGRVAVDGTTLSVNGQSVQLPNGEEATLKDGALIVGTQTVPLPVALQGIASYGTSKFVLDGATFTPFGTAGIVVDGTTLSQAGQSLTLGDGILVSVQMDGALVIGTQTLSAPESGQAIGAWIEHAMSAGDVKTLSDGHVVYDGVTLSKGGPAVTLPDGQVMSLEGSSRPSMRMSLTSSAADSTTAIAGGVSVPALEDAAAASSAAKGKVAAATSDTGILGLGAVHRGKSGSVRSFSTTYFELGLTTALALMMIFSLI